MHNIYNQIQSGSHYNKFTVGDILFVEYTCPIDVRMSDVWSDCDHFVHVVSGKKTWKTEKDSWTLSNGQTLYIKKGAYLIEQYFDDEFCMIAFFIRDDFIKKVVREIPVTDLSSYNQHDLKSGAIMVNNNQLLTGYFHSLIPYFHGAEKPADSMLLLKTKEFFFNILTASDNEHLAGYLQELSKSSGVSITQVMEENFSYNLTIDDFAKLCNRSRSSFKRDFQKIYNTTPGKWLKVKRLEKSAALVKKSELTISEVAFECGFEDISHFSRVFKNEFGLAPSQYR